MTEREAQMAPQSQSKTAAKADPAPPAEPQSTVEQSTVETDGPPPADLAEKCRQEWADANGVDPAEMREIHYPGGWVDRFDGAGWVREEGS